jgi:hypothetical protein
VYLKSKVKYHGTVYDVEYPYGFHGRRVNSRGNLIYKGKRVFISNELNGYFLGVKKVDGENADVWLNSIAIGKIDLKTFVFTSIMSKFRPTKIRTLPMS